jgi:hypothetical protein
VIDKPGKIEHVGISFTNRIQQSWSAQNPFYRGSRSRHAAWPFKLRGSLQEGNALIHITQSQNDRAVGGLSVSVMAMEK